MARRGSFGLQPRVAPNVTGQIVALAREYQAKRDSLIMDAWKNGGTFEGKKATDDMVLAYWNERSKDLDPSDVDYEQAKDQVLQLTYAVAQSKADVLHVQGKISDEKYAQFFLNWAKKVPANSEFYRTLQKDAAQLIESAKAKARANGQRAKTEAFNNFVQSTTAGHIAIGDAMSEALGEMAKKTGLSITGNGDELLSMLTKDIKANPAEYKRLLDALHKDDPHFDGNITEGYFSQHMKDAVQGYEMIADRAQKAGFVTAYASATQGMANMSAMGQNIKVWPVATSYTTLENAFLRIWNDPGASQMDKTSAAEAFSSQLNTLSNTPGIDAGTKSMIAADAQRLLGKDAGDSPSFGTAMLGRSGVDPTMTMQIGAFQQMKAEMQGNPAAYAYAPVDKNGQLDPTGLGPLGIVPAGAIAPDAAAVLVPGHDGKAVMAMIPMHTVFAVDPLNPHGAPQAIGQVATYGVGGTTVNLWAYKDASGNHHWRLSSPMDEGATTTVDNKGDVYVTPAPTPLDTQIASLHTKDGSAMPLTPEQRASLLAGGSIKTLDKDTSGKGVGGVRESTTISIKDGYIQQSKVSEQIDEKGNVTSTNVTPAALTGANSPLSKTALTAGDIPGVTYNSALQASVKAASYTQTSDQVQKFASDPAFQQQFLAQTMNTLGIKNPFDPRIAAAWKSVTQATAIDPTESHQPMNAADRVDLNYPSMSSNPKANEGVNISFGSGEAGATLRLPTLPGHGLPSSAPSYLTPAAIHAAGIDPAAVPGLNNVPIAGPVAPTPGVTPTSVATGAGVTPANINPAATPVLGPQPTASPNYGVGPKPKPV